MMKSELYSAPLTDAQKRAARHQYFKLIQQIKTKETELADIIKERRQEIADMKRSLTRILEETITGYAEPLEMPLEYHFNKQEAGKVEIRHAETGECLEVRDITAKDVVPKKDDLTRDLIAIIRQLPDGKYQGCIKDKNDINNVWFQNFESYEETAEAMYLLVESTTDNWTWFDEVEHTVSAMDAFARCKELIEKRDKKADAK